MGTFRILRARVIFQLALRLGYATGCGVEFATFVTGAENLRFAGDICDIRVCDMTDITFRRQARRQIDRDNACPFSER
jgi:hypothetical protein